MINTILLSKDSKYVSADGNLPKRPPYDKALLSAFCKDKVVSERGFNTLPNSLQKLVIKQVGNQAITLGVTIPEIDEYSNVLLVSRSDEVLEGGKPFRMNKFHCLIKNKDIEVWVKNPELARRG
jgi:hypothetical protein